MNRSRRFSSTACGPAGSWGSKQQAAGSTGSGNSTDVYIPLAPAQALTTAAVSRRVREFGRLKALGWTSRRSVQQIIGESLVIGVIGGAAGIGLGFAGSALVRAFTPTLTASVGQTPAAPSGAAS